MTLARRLLAGFVLATWAAAWLAGCAGCRQIDPEGPPHLPPTGSTPAPVASSLVLPIAVPVGEIGALVDEVIPRRLYSVAEQPLRKGIVRARLDLTVGRNGRPVLETREGLLITHLPLRAEGRLRLVRGVSRPFSTRFTVHAVTDLRLDSTWATEAKTRGAFTWRQKPVLSILGFDIDISSAAEGTMRRQLVRLAPRIDRIIEDRVNLRPRVERLWQSLADPVALRREPPVWLAVRPEAAFFLPAESRADTLVYGLGVRAFMETVVGEEPVHTLGPLPPLRTLPDSLSEAAMHAFQIHLPVSISYDDANRLLADALAAQDFEVHEQVALRLDALEVYGSADTLVARVDFSAKVSGDRFRQRGRVFFTGTPVYDSTAQAIRVEQFDYDFRSRDALAEAAEWFFREDVLEQVRRRLVFPLADRIAAAEAQLEAALQDRALGRHIVLDGTIDRLEPGALYLAEDGLNLDVYARGVLRAKVHALDEIRRRNDADASASR